MPKPAVKQEKPVIMRGGKDTPVDLARLEKKYPVYQAVDVYEQQLQEYFEITHPGARQEPKAAKTEGEGNWVYFPWNGTLVHMVAEKEYNELRTNRNRNLITQGEQQKLLNTTIGVVGLSIGNTIALNLVYNGIGTRIKLADHDALATTNLNRVRARVDQVGASKLHITAQQIYEINPYSNVHLYPKGLQTNTISSFIGRKPKPNIVFDAIDDFRIKVLLREEAKKQKVPVVMLTSLGDSVLIDIERYDTIPSTKPFNGKVSQRVMQRILSGNIGEEEKQQYAAEIVGKEHIPQRAMESLQQIGKTLVGRPQLMSTVTVASGVACYIARKIILREPVASGRSLVKFDDFLFPKSSVIR